MTWNLGIGVVMKAAEAHLKASIYGKTWFPTWKKEAI